MTMPGAGNRVCPRLLFPKKSSPVSPYSVPIKRNTEQIRTPSRIRFSLQAPGFISFKDGKDHYADIDIYANSTEKIPDFQQQFPGNPKIICVLQTCLHTDIDLFHFRFTHTACTGCCFRICLRFRVKRKGSDHYVCFLRPDGTERPLRSAGKC